jgi:signal transduction histidine kinase
MSPDDYKRANKRLYVSITKVKDFGPGIKINELNDLFKPFKKGSAVPTGDEKSTGLGLVISKKIISAHNGTIWAESEEGKGAEFIFSIPVNSL